MNHLKRCKTSTFRSRLHVLKIPFSVFDFYSLFAIPITGRGAVNLIPSTAQRRRWFEIVISGLIIPTYLQVSNFRQWQPAKPRTGTSFFSFEPKTLYGFRNLIELHLNLAGRKLHQGFSLKIFQTCLSDLLDCLCT